MTEKEYRSAEGISHSQLLKLLESPEKFQYLQEHPEEPTEAMIFGQAFHMMVLQPGIWARNFTVAPECNRRTKAGKERWNIFLEESKGKTVLSNSTFVQIKEMADKLCMNKLISRLLDGECEKEFFWNDDQTGERCKCRVDSLSCIGIQQVITDIKTTTNADTKSFMRDAIKYGDHVQTAMYIDGVQAITGKETDFIFIAIEKKPPYAINIMQADPLFIDYGRKEYKRLLNQYHECKTSDNWYGYNGKENYINALCLPEWLEREVYYGT